MSSPSIDRRLGLTGNKAYKAPCDVATTANITLSGEQTIDGVTTSSSRVLVWNQSNTVDNGIWDSSSGSWSRAVDCNTNQDLAKGTQVLVTGGTSYSGQIFEFTSANPIIPGTSAITIVRGISSSTLEARLASTASAADGFNLVSYTKLSSETTIVNPQYPPGNARRYGADPTGAASSTAAFATALATGLDMVVPPGTYLGKIVVRTDHQSVEFQGDVTLKAESNGDVLFKQTESWAQHKGTFRTDSNGKSNVWGMVCGPEDLTQTTTLTQQNHNVLPGIITDSGLAEGIVFQCGPDVGGTDSGCFYNKVPYFRGAGGKRNIWFKDPPNAGGASANRNEVHDFRAGTSGGVACNTGIQIDAGDTNTFFGCDFEGITGAGPNATATAIIVKQASAVNGADNNSNKFFGVNCEANTRDIENANSLTEFYGVLASGTKCLFTATPKILIGNDTSALPQVLPGYQFQGDAFLAGPNNNEFYIPFGKIQFPATQVPSTAANTLDDYEEASWTPTLNATGFSGATYSEQLGWSVKIGRHCFFWARVKLSALTAGGTNALRIEGLPQAIARQDSVFNVRWENLTGGVAGQVPTAVGVNGQTAINLYEQDVDGIVNVNGMQGSRLTTTSAFTVSGSFITAT